MRPGAGQPCAEALRARQISFGRRLCCHYAAPLFADPSFAEAIMTNVDNCLNSAPGAPVIGAGSGTAIRSWRTPVLIVGFGCLIGMMSFGPRSTLGFYLTPLSTANHWGRDVFAFALALQNLLWGLGQPLAGIIADRFGTARVLTAGALMYGAGLALMAHATNAPVLDVSAGALIGFGLSGCSFQVLLAAFGKLMPPQWRSRAFGLGTGRLVRPISLLAGGGRVDGRRRLADHADDFCRQHARHRAAVDRADDAARRQHQGRGAAIVAPGDRRSLRPSLLCALGARLFHLRIPARL